MTCPCQWNIFPPPWPALEPGSGWARGLGAPFCKHRMVCPRCTSYKMAELNVHIYNVLLQNGSLSWPPVTESYPNLAGLASSRIRSFELGPYRMVERIPQGSLDNNLEQPRADSTTILSHLFFFRAFSLLVFKAKNGSCCQFYHRKIIHLYFLILYSMYQKLIRNNILNFHQKIHDPLKNESR